MSLTYNFFLYRKVVSIITLLAWGKSWNKTTFTLIHKRLFLTKYSIYPLKYWIFKKFPVSSYQKQNQHYSTIRIKTEQNKNQIYYKPEQIYIPAGLFWLYSFIIHDPSLLAGVRKTRAHQLSREGLTRRRIRQQVPGDGGNLI